jgi:DNA recombination protein RmuC
VILDNLVMSESVLLVSVIIFLIVGFGIFSYLIYKKLTVLERGGDSENSLQFLQHQINNLGQNLDYKLSETNKIVQDQLTFSNQRLQQQNSTNNDLLRKVSENNQKILQEVTEKLVKVEDTNKQVMNFAEQLQHLEDILKSPKQRGLLGEYFLETMLGNVLPRSVFKMQYAFIDGVIVDAVIFAKEKIIPIDAKFSLEACNRLFECTDPLQRPGLEKDMMNDVKKRIDETSKYIKPEENTIDIAFMFVPADGVYQEIIKISTTPGSTLDIIGYAYSKKVVIVSPTSFFGYLQTLLQAFNTMQIEEQVLDIIKYLNESAKYLKMFEESTIRVGKNLSTVINSFNRLNDDARKLSSRIGRITGNEKDIISVERIENPSE